MRTIVAWLEHLDRLAWHDRRYSMLVNELGMTVSAKEDAEIVEPGHNPLQLYSID
jgi:hypothetical protein